MCELHHIRVVRLKSNPNPAARKAQLPLLLACSALLSRLARGASRISTAAGNDRLALNSSGISASETMCLALRVYVDNDSLGMRPSKPI